MIFSKEEYLKMLNVIHQAIQAKRLITVQDALALSVSYNTLISLYSQYYIKSLKKEYSSSLKSIVDRVIHHNNNNNNPSQSNRSKNSPPSFFAVLQGSQGPRTHPIPPPKNPSSTSYYRLVKYYLEERFGPQMKISDFLVNPSIVTEESLREELLYMIGHDISDAPDISLIKECIGKEYEQLLTNLLNSYHFLYETESDMRKKGKPKTPDAWFTIPMATTLTGKHELIPFLDDLDKHHQGSSSPLLGDQLIEAESDASKELSRRSTIIDFPAFDDLNTSIDTLNIDEKKEAAGEEEEENYVIINWIDSKAMFADVETFQEHYQQLHGYYLRYGRGMVIYWHGVVEDVYQCELYDGNIIIRDSFPEKWIFPTGEVADPSQPPIFELPDEYQIIP